MPALLDFFKQDPISGATGAIAVTPSDSTNLSQNVRAVTINASGTLSFIGWDGVTYTTGTLPAGTYALLATRIRATGTTATGITGWI